MNSLVVLPVVVALLLVQRAQSPQFGPVVLVLLPRPVRLFRLVHFNSSLKLVLAQFLMQKFRLRQIATEKLRLRPIAMLNLDFHSFYSDDALDGGLGVVAVLEARA
jgi:hypothetical protein